MRAAIARAAPWLWGGLVATWLCRFYFALAPGDVHLNHEMYSTVHRTIEFLDLLRSGYLFPHWAVDFRGGLGSPYFGYYEPGFFYLASAFAWTLPVPLALASALWVLSMLGYGGMLALVRPRFGTSAAVLAATALLAAPYVRTDLYVRGDQPEFTGMMLLPAGLACLTAWLDDGCVACWFGVAVLGAACICAHPVAGLLAYGAFAAIIGCWVLLRGDRRRAVVSLGALAGGIGLAGFYLGPVTLEWRLIEGARLTANSSDFRLHFVGLLELLGVRTRSGFVLMQPALGAPALLLALVGVGSSAWQWPKLTWPQRRLVVAMGLLVAATAWLMHPTSVVVWDAVPLLPFLQFPWRFSIVLAVALATLAGCLPRRATIVLVAGLVLQAWAVWDFAPFPLAHGQLYPATARGLTAEFVAPDVADEWMPRGATAFRPPSVPVEPVTTGRCRVEELTRAGGRMRAHLVGPGPCEVVLPHYFFPVGWTATVDGTPVPLDRTASGLMRVTSPSGGTLELRFGTTPGRRLGVLLSATTLALLVVAARSLSARNEPRSASPVAAGRRTA